MIKMFYKIRRTMHKQYQQRENIKKYQKKKFTRGVQHTETNRRKDQKAKDQLMEII